ncbi:MAG TPA: bile acid:sodium symporter [Allosphingosinicella sp.]|nr:bile acid:sodium symporter [Allosphingosinicella sp.]
MGGSIWTQLAVVGLVLTMFGMGMTLHARDFARVIASPWPVTVGLFAQLVGLPVVAFALAAGLRLEPVIALALIALAAAPGGASSNSLTFLSRGDVPLAISLSGLNSLLSFVTTPFVIGVGVAMFGSSTVAIHLSPIEAAMQILLTLVLPLVAGMALYAMKPGVAERLSKPSIYLGLALIIIPTMTLPFRGDGSSPQDWWRNFWLCGALNVGSLALGLLIATIARLDWPQRRTIMIEVGIQNFGLFIVISSVFFRNEAMAEAGTPYLFWMLGTGVAIVVLQRMRDRRTGAAPEPMAGPTVS